MTKFLSFLPAWWFFQIPAFASTGSGNIFAEYGIGIGMVLLIAGLWREDRKGRVKSQTEADKRYGVLVEQLKSIVQDNTKAIVTLSAGMTGKIVDCPLGNDPILGAWLKAWMEQSIQERQKHNNSESPD